MYGSDQRGLIWGYQFSPGQPARPVTSEAAAELLASDVTGLENEFFWLHFSLANAACKSWLQRSFTLPDAFYKSLDSTIGYTYLEQEENTLVAAIHDVVFDFKFDASEVATNSLCIEPRLLLSARHRPLRSVDQLRIKVQGDQVFRSPAELLAHLLQEQAAVLIEILQQAKPRVDRLEDQLLTNRISTVRSELGSLRRVLVRLQRLLAPEPEAFFRLLNQPPDWISEEDAQDLRQAANAVSVAVGDAAALAERIKLLQEELSALVNEQTNRTLFVLTLVTVLALPINVVAGLFGMNVGGIPFVEGNYGFPLIVGTLFTLTTLLAYWALSERRN